MMSHTIYPTHDAAGNPIPPTSSSITINISPYCVCPRCPCCGKLIAQPQMQPYPYWPYAIPNTTEPVPTVVEPTWVVTPAGTPGTFTYSVEMPADLTPEMLDNFQRKWQAELEKLTTSSRDPNADW